ncbi:TRAP transporter substrate-binding protein DctP [Actibacterium sp. MT2.3-13A]|uniref:TRAP transporter substrate-binding protein DctP n=1 Tax=Actibacterium sp. MT2.3-13A TaxID=2828332 RepID=UPI001BA7BA44|nr:TRAP transporter substrate-binding protein DctP [Actibacterium sp. MT2.3-13A]
MTLNRLVFLGAVAAASLAAAGAQAQEFRLNWGHYLSNGPFLQVEQEFIDAVEERSEGRVEFNVVYSGGLGSGGELLTLAGRGAIDMAAVVPGYYADQLLFAKALQIPFVFDSPREAIKVAEYSYAEIPAFQEELKTLRVRRLFHQPLGSYYMAGADDSCATLEGIKGKKVRTFGSDIPLMMDAVGAVPQSVPAGDQYEALERGTLDYAFVNMGNIEAYRLYEPGPNMCGPALSMAGHMVVIGERAWQRLPQDIQDIISDEAAKAQQRYVEWVDESEAAAAERVKAAGANVTTYSAEQLATWQAAAPDLLAKWVEELKGRGRGEEAVATAAKWRELTAD